MSDPILPAELAMAPREPNGRGPSVGWMLYLGAIGAVFVGAGIYAGAIVSPALQRLGSGPPHDATITAMHPTKGKSGPRMSVAYAMMDASGTLVTRTSSLTRSEAAGLSVGSVTQGYIEPALVGPPMMAIAPELVDRKRSGEVLRFVGPLFAAMGGVYWLIAFRVIARKRRLLREGKGAVAKVVLAKEFGLTRRYQSIRYEYSTPSGSFVGRDFSRWGRFWPKSSPPEPGTSVFVVFDPADPKRSAFWGVANT